MAGPFVHAFNRTLLGRHGFALSDKEYARAIAAMGFAPPLPPADAPGTVDRGGRVIRWEFPIFRRSLHDYAWQEPRTYLTALNAQWAATLGQEPARRIVIAEDRDWREHPTPNAGEIAGILSHPAVEARTVSVEWTNPQLDLHWQWPLRVAAFEDEFDALHLAQLTSVWPGSSVTRLQIVAREHARAEILVLGTNVRGALKRLLSLEHRVRAGLVLLTAPLDEAWTELRAPIDALLAETQAGGLALVQLDAGESVGSMLNAWANHLSHAEPLDVAFGNAIGARRSLLVLDRRLIDAAALPTAAKKLGRRLRQLPAEARFEVAPSTTDRIDLGWTSASPPAALGAELEARTAADAISWERESDGASAVTEIAGATREAERTEAANETPRYLQGDVYRLAAAGPVLETRGLVQHERQALDVFIGEAGLGTVAADVALPDHLIDWEHDERVTLQVMFAEPNQWAEPQRGTISLTRTGRSTTHRFEFEPTQTGPFSARIILYYRGRVLQTALLETRVVATVAGLDKVRKSGMSLRVEAAVRRSLGSVAERRRFDAFMVCNHSAATRKAAVTAVGKDGAYIATLGNLDTILANVSDILTNVAHDDARYRKSLTSKGNAELLGRLAIEGNALYRTLVIDYIDRSSSARQIRDSEYVQVVTMAPDAIVPLEFVYDYKVPKEGAPVCPNAKEALQKGACPARCKPSTSPAPHVCPMGFWGLSKVIERHIHVPELEKAAKVLASEPIKGRDTLSLDGGTLLGISQEVGTKSEKAFIKSVATLRGKAVTTTAGNWPAWLKAVETTKPVLLVALPHAEGTGGAISLEIGGDALKSLHIDGSYVHLEASAPPLVVLLGCDTANTADTAAYLHHVGVFRQADAALVVGTVATVLGTHAAEMAARLLRHLQTAVKGGHGGRFGEVLRTAKREAVAESQMIALCVVAFGDADWQIDSKE